MGFLGLNLTSDSDYKSLWCQNPAHCTVTINHQPPAHYFSAVKESFLWLRKKHCIWQNKFVISGRQDRTDLHSALISTPSDSLRMNWNFDCEPGFIARRHVDLTNALVKLLFRRGCYIIRLIAHGFGMRYSKIIYGCNNQGSTYTIIVSGYIQNGHTKRHLNYKVNESESNVSWNLTFDSLTLFNWLDWSKEYLSCHCV